LNSFLHGLHKGIQVLPRNKESNRRLPEMHFKPVGNPQVAGSHHQMQRQVCDRPNGRERMTSIQTVYKGIYVADKKFTPRES
jgi:hypothetical protein